MENKVNKCDGDKQNSPYRSGRFYTVANEWYFSVREAEDQGPYSSKQAAENSLKSYLLDFEHFNSNKLTLNNLKLM